MSAASEPLAVLVIDSEPDILGFFARILDASGMRALLARTAGEAIGIARRGYVPIDVVLSEVNLRPDTRRKDRDEQEITDAHQLMDRLAQLRPGIKPLFMSTHVDSGVIRIELLDRNVRATSQNADDASLIESIRNAAK